MGRDGIQSWEIQKKLKSQSRCCHLDHQSVRDLPVLRERELEARNLNVKRGDIDEKYGATAGCLGCTSFLL